MKTKRHLTRHITSANKTRIYLAAATYDKQSLPPPAPSSYTYLKFPIPPPNPYPLSLPSSSPSLPSQTLILLSILLSPPLSPRTSIISKNSPQSPTRIIHPPSQQ